MSNISVNDDAGDSELDAEQLDHAVSRALDEAVRQGASAAEAVASLSQGLDVSARYGQLETVEHTRDRGLIVSVYFGNRTGSASTSDYTASTVKETVLAACSIAKYTGEDVCHGLADPDRLVKSPLDLDLYHPWEPTVEQALEFVEDDELVEVTPKSIRLRKRN